MTKVVVAAAHTNLHPSIGFKGANNVSAFHVYTIHTATDRSREGVYTLHTARWLMALLALTAEILTPALGRSNRPGTACNLRVIAHGKLQMFPERSRMGTEHENAFNSVP